MARFGERSSLLLSSSRLRAAFLGVEHFRDAEEEDALALFPEPLFSTSTWSLLNAMTIERGGNDTRGV